MIRFAAGMAAVWAFACDAQVHSMPSIQRADAAEPALAVPAVRYDSPFATYRRYADEKPASWRALNDEVERLGGHRGHVAAPTGNEPDRAPAAVDAARAAPSPAPQTVPSPAPKPATSGTHRHQH